jgi:hypothetical protein
MQQLSKVSLLNAFFLSFLLLSVWSVQLAAQRPSPIAEVSGGLMAFTETTESFVGGAARFYVLPRVSLGPEITYIFGENHSHLMVTGNFVFDFLRPQSGRLRRVTPFGLVGGGIFQTRERFRDFNFTSTEGAFTAGGGIRWALGNRVTLGADLRAGWELHIRAGGTIGIRLGK